MNCSEAADSAKNEQALKEKLDRIKNVFIVLSGKGGVGKSTVAVNLAVSLALRGLKTGIMDVDIHGPSVPKLLGLSGKKVGLRDEEVVPLEVFENLKVMSIGFFIDGNESAVIWRGPMKAKMIREFVESVAWGDLDCLVVDCPPGTGDEPLSAAQMFASKGSGVIVTTPQEIATIDVEKCITFCGQLGLPVAGIVENMSGFVCPDCGKEVDIFSSGGGRKLADRFHVPFLGKIPIDPDIVKSGDSEEPYIHSYSGTPTARIFDEIVEQIMGFGKEAEAGARR
ncbi:MAG TPA: Mrp/NBP35 family ATP-binding protein [Syntrophorhabdaceae bacterium]|jgi:Mrp family chromosome partitioning ATPase